MPRIDRDGVNIYYEDHGSGTPILLSHGFSATSRMWVEQVAALKADYRVIVWDMRGHGDTDSPEEDSLYSEALTTGDMAALLDACKIEQAVIAGLSLGGYMSLAFNVERSDRVTALMLFDTGPGYRNDEARDAWNKNAVEWGGDFETKGLETLKVRGSGEMQASWHRSADGLARAARGMLTQHGSHVIESLPGIDVPTLVLVGENDKPFLGATDYMAKKIPNATKSVIPDAGHAANLDQPEAFNAATRAFLGTLG